MGPKVFDLTPLLPARSHNFVFALQFNMTRLADSSPRAILFFAFLSSFMSAAVRIGVVTGANKGIGYEIAKKIGNDSNWTCILTARDESRGRRATEKLLHEGSGVRFRQLDISDVASIERFAVETEQEFGKIDTLVNNGAIAFKSSDPTPFSDQAEPTMNINFFGTVELTERLLPLIKKSDCGRIVNVASEAGHLSIIPNKEIRELFASAGRPDGMTFDQLMEHARKFIIDVKSGSHRDAGWPNTCYGMSKLCLIAYTKILAAREPTVQVTCCCPGYCSTDMSSHRGTKTAEEGSRTPFMLATSDNVSGEFFSSGRTVIW